jgi:hypothetical protein
MQAGARFFNLMLAVWLRTFRTLLGAWTVRFGFFLQLICGKGFGQLSRTLDK